MNDPSKCVGLHAGCVWNVVKEQWSCQKCFTLLGRDYLDASRACVAVMTVPPSVPNTNVRNVVSIASKQPDQAVIRVLEGMLERARSGELSGVVIVAHTPAGITTQWGGTWDAQQMNWALQVWAYQAIRDALEQGVDP